MTDISGTTALDPEAAAADAAQWQTVFDAQEALFAELVDGARMGFIASPGFAPAGRRRAGLDAAGMKCAGAAMLVFAASSGRIVVTAEHFERFETSDLDLLFVADEDARVALATAKGPAKLTTLKRLIRRGGVMFFVLRTRHELQEAGYEDFLDSLGIAFLGSCR